MRTVAAAMQRGVKAEVDSMGTLTVFDVLTVAVTSRVDVGKIMVRRYFGRIKKGKGKKRKEKIEKNEKERACDKWRQGRRH